MVKVQLFNLFPGRWQQSHTQRKRMQPYLPSYPLSLCPASVMRSAAEWVTDASWREGVQLILHIYSICLEDILISLLQQQNNNKRLLQTRQSWCMLQALCQCWYNQSAAGLQLTYVQALQTISSWRIRYNIIMHQNIKHDCLFRNCLNIKTIISHKVYAFIDAKGFTVYGSQITHFCAKYLLILRA